MSHTAQAGKRSYHLEGFYSLYKKIIIMLIRKQQLNLSIISHAYDRSAMI